MFLATLLVNVNNFIAVVCMCLWTVGRHWEQSLLGGEVVAFRPFFFLWLNVYWERHLVQWRGIDKSSDGHTDSRQVASDLLIQTVMELVNTAYAFIMIYTFGIVE